MSSKILNLAFDLPVVGFSPVVYFLFKEKELVYIGQSKNLIRRIGDHSSTKDFDSVKYIEVSDRCLLTLESALIKTHRPRYNNCKSFELSSEEKETLSAYSDERELLLEQLECIECPEIGEYGEVAYVESDDSIALGYVDDFCTDCDDNCPAKALITKLETEVDLSDEASEEILKSLCNCEPKAIILADRKILYIPVSETYYVEDHPKIKRLISNYRDGLKTKEVTNDGSAENHVQQKLA